MATFSSGNDHHSSTLHVSQEIAKCIRLISCELMATEERERHRLAMELHDYLAQLLVVTKMKLEESLGDDHSIPREECVKKAEEMIDQALLYVRSLISDLYPKTLYERGLPAALELLIQRFEEIGMRVTLQHESLPAVFSQEQSTFLFRAIRELLFNVIKHAGVREASVCLRPGRRQNIEIQVEDKGKGFDPHQALQNLEQEKFGLSEICKRAEALGTQVILKSAPGDGTCITFCIPLNKKRTALRVKTKLEAPFNNSSV